ncbi:MAG TPA: LuxR C-terminal-related transcriptional regulator, partial [Streptosporangiaceae bacterium]|nr:LuxR C-terminal-related transcriptional regulator [Streptosporangiaceae bacterium]
YISVHTIAFHLRQIFRKLNISSRVDLTRVVLEQPQQPDPAEIESRRPHKAQRPEPDPPRKFT